MSSPSSKSPSSQASTVIESAIPSNEKINNDPPPLPSTTDDNSDPWLVSFAPDDPLNPLSWPRWKRWYITIAGGILVLNATFASAAPSNLLPQMMDQFGFSEEVATLTVSLFIAGYCLGPLVWGPLSEDIGRRPVFLISFLFYTGFQVGCALSQNTASILVFRFLAGTFAAAPLTNSGGVVGDIWDAKTRGKAMLLFAVSPFAGPALGPVVAGWIAVGGASWRWVFWVLTMFAGFCLALVLFTLPETYKPVLLAKKARQIRKETGEDRYYAPSEINRPTIGRRLNTILAMPFKILFLEPMLMAIAVYQSFLYGCIYLLFEAYPIVFTKGHNLNPGVSGLMFLPISIGGGVGVIVYLMFYNARYNRYIEQYAPAKVPPEARLEATLLGAPLFAISFFWFGWTSYPSISLWSPLLAGGLMGFSIFLIFLSLINYTVDAYLFASASALAASTVSRSIFGTVFPLFARQMFDALNPRWASTLLGLVAAIMIPIPVVLLRHGAYLRSKSRFAPSVTPAKPQDSDV
ncbi:major facilitator superfamily domain-containing protein [Multifurca ochricompacta]|uniref:Major facilitator superfamily domain-containing protein n=1 Tax=Multifurca ochricompacta TaxID=376703 RepID=A0AAD4MCM9_9AGAM|nr:major facilitator superfamily domain-containing protein [Multifurca ochricompacta]